MTSAVLHDFPYFDTFPALESGWDTLPLITSSQFAFDLPQLSSEMEDNDLVSVDSSNIDAFWDFNAPMTPPADQPLSDSDLCHGRSLATLFRPHLTSDLVGGNEDAQVPAFNVSTDRASHYSSSADVVNQLSVTQPERSQHAPSEIPPTPKTVKQAPRRQNHSCDQCRSAKRACDLSSDIAVRVQKPSTICSLCRIRGMKCTVTWLANKQSEQRAKKRSRLTRPSLGAPASANLIPYTEGERPRPEVLISVSTLEANLAREIMAQETCSQYFNLYVDVFDIPISHCLIQDSMPPGYSLGVAALSPMSDSSSLSKCLNRANTWIKGCWDLSFELWGSKVAVPHIFHTVSVLDALFQRNGAHPYRTSMTPRDVAITETYRWAAIALATQFATGSARQKDLTQSDPSQHLRYSHDIASAVWETAKQKVFGNIAATTSFRVALSLLLFGLIPRPRSADRCEELEEDAEYALCEGIRRLHALCAQVRARLLTGTRVSATQPVTDERRTSTSTQNFSMLSSRDKKYIMELVGAVEWMANLINAVVIGLSRGKTRAIAPEMPNLPMSRSHETNTVSPRPVDDAFRISPLLGQSMWPSALTLPESDGVTFTTLWQKGASDETMLHSLRQSAYTAVVMWRSVAGLTMAIENISPSNPNYDDILLLYKTTLSLISVWRSKFGILDSTMRVYLERAPCDLWRTVAFTSNDTDLAILVFCDLTQKLEIRLAQQQFTPELERLRGALRSTSAFRKRQCLASAEQVSMVASTCQRTSRPGFQGSSSLKSHIQDIAAHSNPSMMVQLHKLAAKALTAEVHSSISQLEGKRVSELTSSIRLCRQTLVELRETLVTFPDTTSFDDLVTL